MRRIEFEEKSNLTQRRLTVRYRDRWVQRVRIGYMIVSGSSMAVLAVAAIKFAFFGAGS